MKDVDEYQEESDEAQQENILQRKDCYLLLQEDKDLKSVDLVQIKLKQFTGVLVRIKILSALMMENLLTAILIDSQEYQNQANQNSQIILPQPIKDPKQRGGISDKSPELFIQHSSGIINLRFEECQISSKAVQIFQAFVVNNQLLENIYLEKVQFQDPINDFRLFMFSISNNIQVRKIGIMGYFLDNESYGSILGNTIISARNLRDIDLSQCEFYHPKCFYDLCSFLINEKSKINSFKIKNIYISELEAKILAYLLLKNKSITSIDLSQIKVEASQYFDQFLVKFDKNSIVKYLIMTNCRSDLSSSIENFGKTLSQNTKLEVLIIKENKLKWVPYLNFWINLQGNHTLQKINVSKTELTDRVVEQMCVYLKGRSIKLTDLDLSKNFITDVGLQYLSESLIKNKTIKYLNLGQNKIQDAGLKYLAEFLSDQACTLVELSLCGNKINNEGIIMLSKFIQKNQSIKMLDISRNTFNDQGFREFAAEMGENAYIRLLDISYNREITDDFSLIILAQKLEFNNQLQTLDLTGLRVRKPFLSQYFLPSLKKNIELKYVFGQIVPGIINEQLSINVQIKQNVESNFISDVNLFQQQKMIFNVRMVDPDCYSYLSMKDQKQNLFDAAFKFVLYQDIRQIDFTNMNLQDYQLGILASYLKTNPNLRSLILNDNKLITDDGIASIASALQTNNKLAHLSIMNCPLLSNSWLIDFKNTIENFNMMLCQIDFDDQKVDQEMARTLKMETFLNKAIQEHLKPTFLVHQESDQQQKQNLNQQNEIEESKFVKQNYSQVCFQEGSAIRHYFESAIKCWRIAKPSIINIENQQLNDEHIYQLCEFLKDKNMLLNLNLRRNEITNDGAMAIIDWILNHDKTLIILDVSRNRITKAGAEGFLHLMKQLLRITDLQISYGNPIPLEINLAIQQEVTANNQIKQNQSENNIGLFNSKVTLTTRKYELIDRGPNFIRCATKSVELLKIQHLSLPDNMIGLQEAIMLTEMIKMNPPLRSLNLEQNNLDAQCSQLIAKALQTNSNLQILNLSKNKLSDLGVNWLVQSLIQSRISQIEQQKDLFTEVVVKYQNNKSEFYSDLQNGNQKQDQSIKRRNSMQKLTERSSRQLPMFLNEDKNLKELENNQQNVEIPTEEIEECEIGQLKILDISENLCTLESYKVIQALLQINQRIVIKFDSPQQLKTQPILKLIKNQSTKKAKVQQKSGSSLSTQSNILNTNQKTSIERVYLQNYKQQPNEKIYLDDQTTKSRFNCNKERCFQKFMEFLICFFCYKQSYKNEQLHQQRKRKLTYSHVIFWRYDRLKYSVLKFEPKIDKVKPFENPKIQTFISLLMILSQVFLYAFIITPFFVTSGGGLNAIVFGLCVGYYIIIELISLIIARTNVKFSLCNLYIWMQVLTGLFSKAPLLSVGFLASLCSRNGSTFGIAIASVAIILVLVEQIKIISEIRKIWTLNEGSVMPLTNRTQQLAEVLSYNGLLIVYKKISLLPSKNSQILSSRIAQYLNPDLKLSPTIGFINKIIAFIKINYNYNYVARHIFFIDFQLIILIISSYFDKWVQLTPGVIGTYVICFLDVSFNLIRLFDQQKDILSLDVTEVYEQSQQRNCLLSEKYQEVLARERTTNEILQSQDNEQNENYFSESKIANVDSQIMVEIANIDQQIQQDNLTKDQEMNIVTEGRSEDISKNLLLVENFSVQDD